MKSTCCLLNQMFNHVVISIKIVTIFIAGLPQINSYTETLGVSSETQKVWNFIIFFTVLRIEHMYLAYESEYLGTESPHLRERKKSLRPSTNINFLEKFKLRYNFL